MMHICIAYIISDSPSGFNIAMIGIFHVTIKIVTDYVEMP